MDGRRLGPVRLSLAVAALADAAFAAAALVPVRPLAETLGIPIGEPVMYFRTGGLLYALLPIFYGLGARWPALAAPIAGGAVLARAGGAIFLVAHLLAGEAAAAFGLLLALEVAIGLWHLLALRLAGLGLFGALRAAR